MRNIKSYNLLLKYKYFQAFTLVELIVVIVILSILATISFLSFSSYSSSSRDSVRLGDITSIAKGLTLQYSIGGSYIIPDNSVSLLSGSTTIIGYQGKAGYNTLNSIKLSTSNNNSGKDPLDNTYYTYNINSNKNKYQLSGFLENKGNIINRTSSINNTVENGKYKIENNNEIDNNYLIPHLTSPKTGEGQEDFVILSLSKNPFLSLFGDYNNRNDNLLSLSFGAEGNGVEGIYENNSVIPVEAGIFHILNYNNYLSSFFDIKDLPAGRQVPVTSTRMTNDWIVFDNNSIPHLTSPRTGEELSSLPLTKGELEGVFQINQVNATTYTNRYPYTKGDGIGVILSSIGGTGSIVYTPLEDSGTGIDISSGTLTSGKIVINNNTDSSTGVSVVSMSGYIVKVNSIGFLTAIGGMITTSGNYKIHTFFTGGTFQITSVGVGNTIEYLVVGGGGGGGGNAAGGGGAGGYLAGILSASMQSYSIIIGTGGIGGASTIAGTNGGNSIFGTITANGGGGGGPFPGIAGLNGGSGGGGGSNNSAAGGIGGIGTALQGNNGGGGCNHISGGNAGGGGGGASGIGGDSAYNSGIGGNGGNGTTNSISGLPVSYAGGGGGGGINAGGSGGLGGGGAGGTAINGANGVANTGGGGGGGSNSQAGGTGGSGIVIIRYLYQ